MTEVIQKEMNDLTVSKISSSYNIPVGSDDAKRNDDTIIRLLEVGQEQEKIDIEWTLQSEKLEQEKKALEYTMKKDAEEQKAHRIDQWLKGGEIGVKVLSVAAMLFCFGVSVKENHDGNIISKEGQEMKRNIFNFVR